MQGRRDYWAGFADFVAGETWAGGPSPNLKMVGALSRAVPHRTRVHETWLACCYAAIYNTSGASALYHCWPDPESAAAADDLEGWIAENRPGMPVHSNRRRTHGSPRKMAEGLRSLAEFAVAQKFETYGDYERLWAQVHEIDNVGRYFGIKLCGTLRELGLTRAAQPDIRARGAKNGRRTLALLYPDDADRLDMKTGGNSRRSVDLAETRALEVKQRLEEQHGLDVDWFELEALLCEFNQLVKGHRYPGSTSDGDAAALAKAEAHFREDTLISQYVWLARESVLPHELVRSSKDDALVVAYRDHGYVWSDALYDRSLTEDPASPAVRSEPLTDRAPLTRPEGGAGGSKG